MVAYIATSEGMDIRGGLTLTTLILTLYLCVVLHEYGHALTARKYGIETRDIIISPIGGLARLEGLPDRPLHEMLIAIAGPLVNVVIAILLTLVLTLVLGEPIIPHTVSDYLTAPTDVLRAIIVLNIILFLFNLIPAFPMDGGRILRALLSMKFGRARGTLIASIIGRIIAVGFIFYAVFNNQITTGFIGVFVFLMASMENRDVQLQSKLKNGVAQTIMRTDWSKIHISETMQSVIDKYLRGGETSYMVYDSLGYIMGGIPELYIKDAIKNNEGHLSVSDRLSHSIAYASPSTPIHQIYQTFANKKAAIVLIKQEEDIIGLIDMSMMKRYIA